VHILQGLRLIHRHFNDPTASVPEEQCCSGISGFYRFLLSDSTSSTTPSLYNTSVSYYVCVGRYVRVLGSLWLWRWVRELYTGLPPLPLSFISFPYPFEEVERQLRQNAPFDSGGPDSHNQIFTPFCRKYNLLSPQHQRQTHC
jgi:hypothetical protein